MDILNAFSLDVGLFSSLVKGIYILGLLTYLIFSLLVIKQVRQMVTTVNGVLTEPLKLISYLHFLVALGVFCLAIIVL